MYIHVCMQIQKPIDGCVSMYVNYYWIDLLCVTKSVTSIYLSCIYNNQKHYNSVKPLGVESGDK